jgi:uncharacterized protein (DUF1810 family)
MPALGEHLHRMSEDFDLQRFIDAQDADGTYERAGAELRSGHKQSHWMWFVFPQLAGLGHSSMAQRYAISGLPEARAFLYPPVLGLRLLDCVQMLLQLPGNDPVAVFGQVDAQKLQSSMTLFSQADPQQQKFTEVLRQYFAGEADKTTIDRL